MKSEELFKSVIDAKRLIIEQLTEYVKEKGTDITEEERVDFTLEDELEKKYGFRYTKIINFDKKDGCVIISQRNKNPEIDIWKCRDMNEVDNLLDDEFLYDDIMCLYLEEYDNGEIQLCYYCMWNTGTKFSDVLAECEHGSLENLPLEALESVIQMINYYESKN